MASMSVVVWCGNGGDWEFENDRHWWRTWIKKNITNDAFVIKPHDEADKAIVTFEADKWDTFFILKKPDYISRKVIEDLTRE